MNIRILASMVVLIAFVAAPRSGRAIVCHPNCPAVAPAPKISEALLAPIVERYLAEHPPVLRFELRKPLGAYPPAAYDDLTRAGLLYIVSGRRRQDPGPRYDLTAKGRAFAGTPIGRNRRPYTIDIPVGKFQYVPGSAAVGRDELDKPAATFSYRFNGNAKASMLLRFGPAIDWVIANYSRPHLNLAEVGRVGKQTLPLAVCHGKWMVRPPRPCGLP